MAASISHRFRGNNINRIAEGVLQDAAGATDTGAWVALDGVSPLSITVEGTFVGTVILYGSNDAAQPPNTDNNRVDIGGGSITAPQLVVITAPLKWIKARVSAWTSGAIDVFFKAGG